MYIEKMRSFENRNTTVLSDQFQTQVHTNLSCDFEILDDLRRCATVLLDVKGVEDKSGQAEFDGLETSDAALEGLKISG